MKARFVFSILTALLIVSFAFTVQKPALGQNALQWEKIKKADDLNAQVEAALNAKGIIPDKQTFKYVMNPGDSVSETSDLADFFPSDLDIFVFILLGNGQWKMEIIDCCVTGDTMIGFGKVFPTGQTLFGQETSPVTVKLGPVVTDNFAVVIVIVGYTTPHSGIFSAGYDIRATFN